MAISSLALATQRWPKTNSDWVVEECLAIRASNFRRGDGRHSVSGRSRDQVYGIKSGACIRWYFKCPSCGKLVETLYRPPKNEGDPWGTALGRGGYACRRCHRLVYASQRY